MTSFWQAILENPAEHKEQQRQAVNKYALANHRQAADGEKQSSSLDRAVNERMPRRGHYSCAVDTCGRIC